MEQQDRKWLSWLIIVGLIVISTAIGVKLPDLPPPPSPLAGGKEGGPRDITNFTGLEIIAPTEQPTATPAAIVDSYGVSALLEIRDASTPVARYTDGGALDLLTGAMGLSFADITATNGLTITPTYNAYALDSAAAVTVTLAACTNEGQLLILIGDDNNTVKVDDVNIRTSGGNALTIAQYDAVVMICQDTEWMELLKIADQ
jgi:hypothetical protein